MNKKLKHLALIGIFTSTFSLLGMYGNVLNCPKSVYAQETQTYSSDENNASTYLNNVTINGENIGFSYIESEYTLRIDNPSGKFLLKVYPESSDTTIKVSNTTLNSNNSIILRMSKFGIYKIPITVNNKITNKTRTYVINIYRGVNIENDTEDSDITTGWIKDEENSEWKYVYGNGEEAKSAWIYDSNFKNYYYFDEFGYMQKNWVSDNEGTYFLDGSGALYRGWINLYSSWYYLDEDTGLEKESEWYKDKNNVYYYFNDDGVMQTSWVLDNDKWYYLDYNGKMQKGWLYYKNDWYYLNDSGDMQEGGWKFINGTWYYFYENGKMAKWWIEYNDEWYYLNDDGSMKTGWFYYKNEWYFLKSDGNMTSGEWYFDSNDWYYINYSGTMRTGWLSKDGKLYYLNEDGKMEKNGVLIEGVYLRCNSDGSVEMI
ncbi:cadherin-like beta sandwich domain-containing protein [Clostridium sp. BJN0001]|uniref:cadherin-like beta sandwich domain-containing protein n=1 Tax=Clostridium sp. BJN0001 TaxID=2930219 RepID=UPI001FD4DFBD|nr:cadherin-like beta sandwich domain-containing protein [Clostridium sp. BJN0001]